MALAGGACSLADSRPALLSVSSFQTLLLYGWSLCVLHSEAPERVNTVSIVTASFKGRKQAREMRGGEEDVLQAWPN